MSKKIIHTSGKRKRAVARATLKDGKGKIRINKVPLDMVKPELYQLKISEPLILSGVMQKIDINVNVQGGGIMSQADAARTAIGRALTEYMPKLKAVFLQYDRQILVPDVRRKEATKPNRHGSARSKKQKSYR